MLKLELFNLICNLEDKSTKDSKNIKFRTSDYSKPISNTEEYGLRKSSNNEIMTSSNLANSVIISNNYLEWNVK